MLPLWLAVVAQDSRLQAALAGRDVEQARRLVNRLVHRHGLTAVHALLTGPLQGLYGPDAVVWLARVSRIPLLPPDPKPLAPAPTRAPTPAPAAAPVIQPRQAAPPARAPASFPQSITLSATAPITAAPAPSRPEPKPPAVEVVSPPSPVPAPASTGAPSPAPVPAPAPAAVAALRPWLAPGPGLVKPDSLPHPPVASPAPPAAPTGELPLAALAALARYGLLRPFLRQRLLSEALAAEQLSQEERQQALAAFAREHQLAKPEDLERHCQQHLLTPEALAEQVERPARLLLHCDRLYRPKAEARFLARKTQLDRVVYSLLRLADAGLAQELYLQLLEGEADFAELAATYSEGPERSTRGIVGPVPLTQAHPQLVERLRTSPAGVVQEPFRVDRWWLVFRLESLTPASFDEAMARQMSQELLEQWLETAVEARLQELRPLLLAPAAGTAR